MPEDENDTQGLEAFFKFRENMQNKYLQKYDELYGEDFNIVELPLLDHEVRGIEKLSSFSENLVSNPEELKNLKDSIIDNDQLKWVFCGGKGGVGKTTSSCSLAIQLAKERKSVLLISTDPAHNTSDAFNQKFTKSPTKVEGFDNLFCMEITPDFNILEVKDSALQEDDPEAVHPLLGISKKWIADLLVTCPGIDEALAYYEIWRLVEKLDYDVVVFDTAPTGHTLRLLDFPTIMENAMVNLKDLKDSLGNISGMMGAVNPNKNNPLDIEELYSKMEKFMPAIRKIRDQFRNPEQTTFVAICIAEFLSLYETERLIQELMKLEIDCNSIVINQLVTNSKQKQGLMNFRRKIQNKYLDNYDDLYGEDFHLVRVPLLDDEIRGVDKLIKFGNNLIN